MNEELKPCPFCDVAAEMLSPIGDFKFCRCPKRHKCPTHGKPFLMTEWNSRPREDKLNATVEEMSKFIKEFCNICRNYDQKQKCCRSGVCPRSQILKKARGEE